LISYILAFFAGEFLAIGASDLLPEAHSKDPSWRLIGLTLMGVGVVFVLTRFA
jgi:zinc transporter ZupT